MMFRAMNPGDGLQLTEWWPVGSLESKQVVFCKINNLKVLKLILIAVGADSLQSRLQGQQAS